MSIAGVYSNRGDHYQTLVAFDWALSVLEDPQYQWIEVDSVEYPDVDDIVVGKVDGTLICCQCKKNQTAHKSWAIGDLKGELEKAIRLIVGNERAIVRFYSRTPFGNLSKLREYREIQPNIHSFDESLPKGLLLVNEKLASIVSSLNYDISTYDLVGRIVYSTTEDMDRMEDFLRERLRRLASKSEVTFEAIWTLLDRQGARIQLENFSTYEPNKITKQDLIHTIEKTGAILGPIQDTQVVRLSFNQTSKIGRSWKRDIHGHLFATPLLDDILFAIHEKVHSILITGGPGSGKTCLLLNLQEELEKYSKSNPDIVSLFVQAREFSDCNNLQDLEAWGYPELLIQKTSRLAEKTHVVVIIDSLDVLSISRDHWILSFFLTQLDRLLNIPNVSVLTACRIFDRHYDRRIAVHNWEREFECQPLNWEDQIVPFLESLKISANSIDENTRELIKNPRELELFVELAIRKQDVKSVTSQELAQRYLDVVVGNNTSLGDPALEAIEDIADEMLKARSLVVPRSKFLQPDLLPILQSLNVLQVTGNNMIALGHQTLLDVLIINRLIKRGVTIYEFILDLPPVPFVRPSIRSFINHLFSGDRQVFRKQIRTVLTSNMAFSIRRLVAETIASIVPSAEDWPLLRDLRRQHNEVFQVVYMSAQKIEWFSFWNSNLVPMLIAIHDHKGLIAHAHRIDLWKNGNPQEVIEFWTQILNMGIDHDNQFAYRIDVYLSDIDIRHAEYIVPLLKLLLKMPKREYSLLGHSVTKCVIAGAAEDTLLWNYIAGDLQDDDIKSYNFNKKFYCMPHEFGNQEDNFLSKRMNTSEILLDLSIEHIEKWSNIKWGDLEDKGLSHYWSFLSSTSYRKAHNRQEEYHEDSKNIFFNAVEASIEYHSGIISDWWTMNRERLVRSTEASLRYFVILTCTSNPESNLEVISWILTNTEMLESGLSYEIGLLIKGSYIYFEPDIQSSITKTILGLYSTDLRDTAARRSVQIAKFIKCIPSFKRSSEAQSLLDTVERSILPLVLDPEIHWWGGGTIRAPFSYKVFLNNLDDDNIIFLLDYYDDFQRSFDEHLVGGKEEVGRELSEASSRNPTKFLKLIRYRSGEISNYFIDMILGGIAHFIEYEYGDYQKPENWNLIEKPNITIILQLLLNILDRIQKPSNDSYSQSLALRSCAHIVHTTEDAFRVVFLVLGYRYVHDDREIDRNPDSLIFTGINMSKGHVAEALIILAARLIENDITFPNILVPALSGYIQDDHPAIRAVILRRLSYLLFYRPDIGWDLLNSALFDSESLWATAEHCLYQMYNKHFDKVRSLLDRLYNEGSEHDYETWGRISSLSVLSGHIDIIDFLRLLYELGSEKAWKGASTVWTHSGNLKKHEEICLTGILSGLKLDLAKVVVAEEMVSLFRDSTFILLPLEIVVLYLSAFAENDTNRFSFLGLEEWLNKLAQFDPELALDGIEAYIECALQKSRYLSDYKNNITQLMTRLFAEAEEREESDSGNMLNRVVSAQDRLLAMGVNGINEWLRAAERP